MSVPLGHKNHKSNGSCSTRVYSSKPGYVYEVEFVNNPILGEVYQLTVIDSYSSARTSAERSVWKSPKWKRNPLLTRTFNKVVPKYNEYENKDIKQILICNDGHLYSEGGKTFFRVHDYDNVVESIVVHDGVERIAKDAFQFVLAKKLYLPQSIKNISFGAFYGTETLEEIHIAAPNIDFSEECDMFFAHKKVYVPKDSLEYYNKELHKFINIEIIEN